MLPFCGLVAKRHPLLFFYPVSHARKGAQPLGIEAHLEQRVEIVHIVAVIAVALLEQSVAISGTQR